MTSSCESGETVQPITDSKVYVLFQTIEILLNGFENLMTQQKPWAHVFVSFLLQSLLGLGALLP